jgi:hypothetical protein
MAAPDGLPHVIDVKIPDTEALREEVFRSKEDCLTLVRRCRDFLEIWKVLLTDEDMENSNRLAILLMTGVIASVRCTRKQIS